MKEIITYDDFAKLELRVGAVRQAVRVDGSVKLLNLTVDIGGEDRQIVAGIGAVYTPEDMIGRQIVVVANLAPRIMMGLQSQGMLLAADSEGGPVLVCTDRILEAGAEVK